LVFSFAFVPGYIFVSLKHPIQRKAVEKGATEGIIAKLNNFNASLDASNSESHEKKTAAPAEAGGCGPSRPRSTIPPS